MYNVTHTFVNRTSKSDEEHRVGIEISTIHGVEEERLQQKFSPTTNTTRMNHIIQNQPSDIFSVVSTRKTRRLTKMNNDPF